MPAPVSEEFRLLYDQQNYGMSMPDALKVFAERMPVLDARFFVTAVLIQRESGGNLAEVLDNLSGVIRDRFKVKRQMRVASAHGRITGWVLRGPAAGAGPGADGDRTRRHRELMFGETLGIQMMIGAAILQGIGTLIIRKIINVPYSRRTMDIGITVTLAAVFIDGCAWFPGRIGQSLAERSSPTRRRLNALVQRGGDNAAHDRPLEGTARSPRRGRARRSYPLSPKKHGRAAAPADRRRIP